MAPKLTKNMLAVLKRLYRSPDGEGKVHMITAAALNKHGLLAQRRGQSTWGGNFPHDIARLSEKGRAFCKRTFDD